MTLNYGTPHEEDDDRDCEHDHNNRAQAEAIRSALRRKQHAAYIERLRKSGEVEHEPAEGPMTGEVPHTRPHEG